MFLLAKITAATKSATMVNARTGSPMRQARLVVLGSGASRASHGPATVIETRRPLKVAALSRSSMSAASGRVPIHSRRSLKGTVGTRSGTTGRKRLGSRPASWKTRSTGNTDVSGDVSDQSAGVAVKRRSRPDPSTTTTTSPGSGAGSVPDT
jgi:hypothetical protein